MQLYIAGPMRGRSYLNFPNFWGMAKALEKAGHKAFNPCEKETKVGTWFPDLEIIPESLGGWHVDEDDLRYRDIMRQDLVFIMNSEGIVVLDRWEESVGARSEVRVAMTLRLPIFTYDVFNGLTYITDYAQAVVGGA